MMRWKGKSITRHKWGDIIKMVFKKQGENLAGSNWLTIMLSGKTLPT
jgi:hypothetical protein